MTEQLKYYTVMMEAYDKNSEKPWFLEKVGLFKSYRDASEHLINNEMFDVFPEHCGLWEKLGLESYDLHFKIGTEDDDEMHIAYIEEWKVLD